MKFISQYTNTVINGSLPAWECGLKCPWRSAGQSGHRSLPAWECGLKSVAYDAEKVLEESLPAWECGLKFLEDMGLKLKVSHSLRGSVD